MARKSSWDSHMSPYNLFCIFRFEEMLLYFQTLRRKRKEASLRAWVERKRVRWQGVSLGEEGFEAELLPREERSDNSFYLSRQLNRYDRPIWLSQELFLAILRLPVRGGCIPVLRVVLVMPVHGVVE
jgi:hypothetical protein